ncbi:MAG TPA: hypothetical protein VIJ75_02080 [Hanamia sp.]
MQRLWITFAILLLSPVLFTSCLTSKKVDRQVTKYYSDVPEIKKKKQDGNISITSSLENTNGQISTTETKTSNMLPLIVYWKWDYTNTCTLDPQIPINNFKKTVDTYAKKGLIAKLAGQNLELSIDKIPHKFQLLDKAHLIPFIVGWDDVSIKASDMEMTVSYRVLKDNVEMKKGIISIPSFNDKESLGMYKSWKKATNEYLTQFDENISTMSKLVVDKLMNEL